MKKRILSILLAVITVLQVFPVFALPIIAEDSSVVGSIVRFKTTNMTQAYKNVTTAGASGNDRVYPYNYPETLMILDVVTVTASGYTYYKLGTVDGSAHAALDVRPWFNAGDLEIVTEPEPDDGYIHGKVDISCDEAVGGVVTLEKGGKTHAFTKLDAEISDNAKYQWQMKLPDGRWAAIMDYILPYAVLSEALLVNNMAEDGVATLRCIVTDGGKQYASDELGLTLAKDSPVKMMAAAPRTEAAAENESSVQARAAEEVMEAAEGNAVEGFEVKVEFLYRHANPARPNIDGETAANGFTVTLYSAYSGTVTCPPVVGYSPYMEYTLQEGDVVDGTTIREYPKNSKKYYIATPSYEFKNQTEKIHVVVYYLPNQVSFIVQHYEQNLYNDNYTPVKTDRLTGEADSPVGAGLEDKEQLTKGFTALYYDPKDGISANGTTVVEIYYDRIYYLVDFDLNEGDYYGVVPYFVRYGTQITLGTPTKPGYSFNRWKLIKFNEETTEPDGGWPLAYTNVTPTQAITIKDNLKYQAVWDVATTTYTIIYWLENADDDGFTLDSFEVVEGVAPNTTVNAQDTLSRSDKNCFIFNEGRSDKNVIVKGDGTTAVNVYYNRKYINLIFKGVGNCAYTHTHGDGTCVAPLICGIENLHIHDASCGTGTLACKIEVHTHTETCRTSCTLTEHTAHTISCLNCNVQAHQAHLPSCYDGAGDIYTPQQWWQEDVTGTESEGSIGRIQSWGSTTRYIYINGSWYEYEGTVGYGNGNNKAEPKANCQLSHAHNASCWKDSLHTHSLTCCGKAEHTHDSNKCYSYKCGLVQHEHTDSCYGECTKLVHTHNNAANCSSDYVKVVTQKYDAYIADIWPIVDNNGYEYKDSGWWKSSVTQKYYTILHKMPNQDITLTFSSTSGSTYSWDYALQQLDGSYSVAFSTSVKGNGISLTYDEDYFPLTGFTQRDNNVPSFSNNKATLYYTRNSYKLIFHDGERQVYSQNFLYEADISQANTLFELKTPNSKEAGSVKFAGWYTTPTCADGTEFDFSSQIMPARDLTLYAKWVPMTYNIEVYLDIEQTQIATPHEEEVHGTKFPLTVKFGDRITEPDITKIESDFTFAGWYYKENGEEKRFDFNTMSIKKDYVKGDDPNNTAIYAKWTSHIPVPYVVYYRLEGTTTDIAEPTRGESLAAVHKSFVAKVGAELYSDYQKGYFPNVSSTSMEMKTNAEENVFVFEYKVPTVEISYTITHTFTSDAFVDLINTNSFTMTLEEVKSNPANEAAYVNVDFKYKLTKENVRTALEKSGLPTNQVDAVWKEILNLSPNKFKQNLILTVNDDHNVVAFDWKNAGLHGLYQVVHHMQSLTDPTQWVAEYTVELIGDYGKEYNATEQVLKNLAGFHLNEVKSKEALEGAIFEKVSSDNQGNISGGLVLDLYYDRNEVYYTVIYNLYSIKGVQVQTVVPATAVLYETVVTHNAVTPQDYKLVGDATQTHKITTGTKDNPYQISFDFNVFEVMYIYQAIPSNAGTMKNNFFTETVGSGTYPQGATPVANDGWVFEGWYTDPACTNRVTDDIATVDPNTKQIKPVAPHVDQDEMALYFYAKFIPTTRVFTNAGVADEKQAFIYRLKGTEGTATASVDITFVIIGNNSVTLSMLPYGDYTVTVQQGWSWRYNAPTVGFNGNSKPVTETLTLNTIGDVTFTYGAPKNQWLTSDDSALITTSTN